MQEFDALCREANTTQVFRPVSVSRVCNNELNKFVLKEYWIISCKLINLGKIQSNA